LIEITFISLLYVTLYELLTEYVTWLPQRKYKVISLKQGFVQSLANNGQCGEILNLLENIAANVLN